ncbi:MAG: SprB repeat-containing protein, partial [Flavobacteriales bacterium]|nr:SprB repeat-containing protein [Flavobacteriales bacterium]
MRRIIGIAAVLVSFLSAIQANGQAIGGEWEVYQVHYGTVGTTDLTGYVTYRLALTMQNEADIVSAVFGSESGQACDNIAEGVDIDLHFDCNVFQVPTGGPTLDDINCGFISFVPELEYDSYVTIDRFCNDDAGPFFTTPWLPSCGSFATWEAGGDLFIDDGAWFVTYPGNGPAGADNKIYVMQVTTCGNITGCLWVSTFVNGLQSQIEDTQVCFDIENPCESNPLDPQVNIIDDIDCFGELATVEIGDGTANGAISYTMFVNDVPQTPQSTNSYTNLSANTNYFVAVEDEIGCRDTSEVFFFTEPPLLILQSELTEDVMCFGDTDALITNDYQGGTDPVTFYLNDDMANGVPMGTNFEDLGCGSYEVMVEDNNGCRDSIVFEVACPAQLLFDPNVTNSSCNALDNGSIQGNLTGGTGTTTASWTSSVDVTFNEVFTGSTPLNISIANLEPAIYTISVEDANGCLLTAEFEITEPDPMITVVTPTPASCNGISDGSIDASASGGTPDYIFSNQELGGGSAPFEGLPAGEYVVITEDEQGCQVFDTVEVLQPAAVVFDSLTVQDVSCFGLCDGLIQFNGLGGGEGNIVLNTIPILTQNGSGDGFIDACQGNYTILALDEGNNCSYSIASAEIIEPAELIMDVEVSEIDCFGSTNGGFVVNCSGGTGAIEVMINDTLMDCGMPLDSLLPGNYVITLTDETLCTTSQTFTLTEPDELLLTILSTTDLTCGGDADGAVVFDFEGGTPATTGDPYSFLLNGVPSTLIDLIQLEAGDYELCVEDGNMCLACDTFAINEPDPISFLFNITNTSCTGMSDGA